jgi:hypothetical protein
MTLALLGARWMAYRRRAPRHRPDGFGAWAALARRPVRRDRCSFGFAFQKRSELLDEVDCAGPALIEKIGLDL